MWALNNSAFPKSLQCVGQSHARNFLTPCVFGNELTDFTYCDWPCCKLVEACYRESPILGSNMPKEVNIERWLKLKLRVTKLKIQASHNWHWCEMTILLNQSIWIKVWCSLGPLFLQVWWQVMLEDWQFPLADPQWVSQEVLTISIWQKLLASHFCS